MFPKVFSTRVAEGSHVQKTLREASPEHVLLPLSRSYSSRGTSEQIKPWDFLEKASEQKGAKPCWLLQELLATLTPAIPSRNGSAARLPTSPAQTRDGSRPGKWAPTPRLGIPEYLLNAHLHSAWNGQASTAPASPQPDETLSKQSPAVAEPLIGSPASSPFLGTMFLHLHAETRAQTLYFCISPRLSKLSSKQ